MSITRRGVYQTDCGTASKTKDDWLDVTLTLPLDLWHTRRPILCMLYQ